MRYSRVVQVSTDDRHGVGYIDFGVNNGADTIDRTVTINELSVNIDLNNKGQLVGIEFENSAIMPPAPPRKLYNPAYEDLWAKKEKSRKLDEHLW